MTASTEQERALYECIACEHLYEQPDVICDCCNNPERKFNKWVARRAQVVPQGWKLIPEDATEEWLTALRERGVRVGSFESLPTDVLAAAPQPPEAACNPSMQPELATLAAPVQMPEPAAFALEWTFNGEERGMRLYDDETHCRFDAESDGAECAIHSTQSTKSASYSPRTAYRSEAHEPQSLPARR